MMKPDSSASGMKLEGGSGDATDSPTTGCSVNYLVGTGSEFAAMTERQFVSGSPHELVPLDVVAVAPAKRTIVYEGVRITVIAKRLLVGVVEVEAKSILKALFNSHLQRVIAVCGAIAFRELFEQEASYWCTKHPFRKVK